MLTRIYVDNFRALVNSELLLERRTLLMGRNGSGKSTFGDALIGIQVLLFGQSKTDDIFGPGTLTRWQQSPRQRFELDVSGPLGSYRYQLVIDHRETSGPDQPRTRVIAEILTLNGNPLFRFEEGVVHLFRDDHGAGPEYPFDWGRSALGTIAPRHDNQKLTWFGQWFRGLTVLKPDPQQIASLVDKDEFFLLVNGQNFAAWYHAASAADKRRDHNLHTTLSETLPGFEALNFEFAGPNRWYLRADFAEGGRRLPLYFNELSDGQRSLIVLYSVLLFLVDQGNTVFLDEPDNFVSLDEIQPWLLVATDMVDGGSGQLVVVSHHPEIFNQWAIAHGVVAERDGCGPVRIRRYSQPSESELTPAETMARGWSREADHGTPSALNQLTK
jgi:energy-coupling factor transporter ATP-binding protein EcfA2